MKRLLLILTITAAAAFAAAAQCSDSDKRGLEAFDRAWGTAGEQGDRAALMAIYSDDYVGYPGMMNKMDTIENTMRTFAANKAAPASAGTIAHDSYDISCTANSATIVHRNIASEPGGPQGKPVTYWTRSVHFLEKRGGKWQVVSNAGHDMDDAMILRYLEHDWNAAAIKKDGAWFEKYYAADYTSVSSRDGSLTNKAQDIADTLKGGGDDWNELSQLNIRIDGNTAIVTGVNHVKGKDDKGVAFDRKVRFTDTWIKRDGYWQAWATQGTRLP